jgi:hypothetical protein
MSVEERCGVRKECGGKVWRRNECGGEVWEKE